MSSDMVAVLEWANSAPDDDNNYEMACSIDVDPADMESYRPNVPMAVLLCQESSHPFLKRTLQLSQTVRIGRSMPKIKADPSNAIFDCKVLSRHHASLWYDNGHFYLMDTKSSNGTFINNRRLSEGGTESIPYEVSSGDSVKFGVEVVENSGSVTHGCIVATIKLYLPDGKEAKVPPNMSMSTSYFEELQHLNRIIQEAAERECMLEEKLNALRQQVESCRNAVDSSWHAQVCEDHLLYRVNFLERRLAASNSNIPQSEVENLLEDKYKYEVIAKESLRQAQEDRLKLTNQVYSLQRTLCITEDECAVLRNNTERTHEEHQKLICKYTVLEQKLKSAQYALSRAENHLAEEKRSNEQLIEDHEHLLKREFFSKFKQTNRPSKGKLDTIGIRSTIFDDNKTWEDEESSLSESIRGLPNYIKAMLPEQILEKVGCESIKSSSQINELELKLYNLKEELAKRQLENQQSADKVNDNTAHALGDDKILSESTVKIESLNNSSNDIHSNDVTKPSIVISDCSGETIVDDKCRKKEYENDHVAENRTEQDSVMALLDDIKKLTEQNDQVKEDGPIEKMTFLQEKLSNAHSEIASLKNDQKTLQDKIADFGNKITELKQDKEQLLLERSRLNDELNEKSELCTTLEMHLTHWSDKEKNTDATAAKYKENIAQLRDQLVEALAVEVSATKTINDLNATIQQLREQLDENVCKADVLEFKIRVESLQSDLASKEREVEELQKQVDILTDVQVSLEEKLNKSGSNHVSKPHNIEEISSTLSAADFIWDQDPAATSSSDLSSSAISVNLKRLLELEEELVITKEKWAHVNEDRAQLATELQNMTDKYNNLASHSITNILIYLIPLVGILVYVLLMYQSVS